MAISNATRLANYVGAAITADGTSGIITAQSFIGSLAGTASTASFATTSFGLSGTPNLNVGIVTANQFIGNISGVAATFTGNVSIAGTLTYEDVTNVDSIGLITARNGIVVNSGGVNVSGVITATSFFDTNGSIKGVGIATAGGIVGTGVTLLDFRNSGVSTVTVSSGIATLQITGGGGGGGGFSAVGYIMC